MYVLRGRTRDDIARDGAEVFTRYGIMPVGATALVGVGLRSE